MTAKSRPIFYFFSSLAGCSAPNQRSGAPRTATARANPGCFAAHCGIAFRTYKRLELGESDSIGTLIRVAQYLGRAAGFDMLFPPQPLVRPLRGAEAALHSIRAKLDARVVKGERILDEVLLPEAPPDRRKT